MTSLKIRFFFKNLKINYLNLLQTHLITINYSRNLILKKKHIMYNVLKKYKNK
jgi:hypothetical protein